MTSDRIEGLIAATYTPMREDGSLNAEAVDPLAQHLSREGVSGVFVCGTTGEFSSLTLAERRELSERWVRAAPNGFRVIQHVGSTCLDDAIGLARHAESIGAHAVSSIGPYFFKPIALEALVAYCEKIAAAAPSLPFYYYHLPALSGIDVRMPEFLAAASTRIANFAGIKFSEENGVDLARCLAFRGGAYDILFGCDELLLTALSLGCRAAVGTTYGFMAPLYQRVLDAFAAGDVATAQRHQLGAIELVEVFKRYGGHRAMKTCMKLRGIDCGPVRAPLTPLSADELAAFKHDLDGTEFGEILLEAAYRKTPQGAVR